MIIYEVNLIIDNDIYPQYLPWLKQHAAEMIRLPGFIQAYILKPEKEKASNQEKLTVQYHLENKKALDHYFENFAANMQKEGITLFKNKFSAERKTYTVEKVILIN